ncbi:MAG: sigma-70 family RNA polymerase sigma factor [Acidobacteriia bacterium]|nr:sigma-70 family RNA polymerase sigma factor [Terriglobia bacterium]
MAEEFERIVRDYQDRIFRLAWSMMGSRAAAEEAAQEALVRIWKGLPRFRGESSLSTWIYSITRNTCLTALARGGIPADSLEDPAVRRAAERSARARSSVEASRDAAELLSRLPVKYRQVVALFYMQEKSYEEVAEMLGLPMGTVKTYLFRARKMLAEEVARERVKGGA